MGGRRVGDKAKPARYAAAVPTSWRLFTDDERERHAFRDLSAVRALPGEPAGPPNRLRQVTRVSFDGRAYFLKEFRRTQPKNRVHFALTRPRARDDADRERRVTDALRARGHGAPRPIAYGRDGAASYYLCAELPGEPLTAHIERGDVDAALLRQVSEHCGALLGEGFRLPDLSADHVFVRAGNGSEAVRLSVLDLHNAGVAPAGPAPSRLLRRVLRRFARSVRELPVGRLAAMRFASRLLRRAGAGRRLRRRLLTAAQSFGTAARYEQGGRSARYAERNPKRHAAELRLLTRVWPGRAGESVLDLPCGAGRLQPFLQDRGHRIAQGDGALAMLREVDARGRRGGISVQADALQMPFADGAVDGVVMFRFLHHLPPEAMGRALAEAGRVARRFVVVSFFHPCSVHHVQRRLGAMAGTPTMRFAATLGTLRREFAKAGFALHARAAQLPFARDLWLAAFVREGGAAAR